MKGAKRHLLLDLRSSIYNYPGKVLWSRIRIRNDGTVTGMRETRGWAPGRQLFFAIRFSAAMSGHALYNREEDPPPYRGFKTPGTSARDTQSVEGRGLEAVFDFAPSADPLIVKVALSPVSEQNAIANMDAETPDFNFDGVRARTQQMWREELSRVDFSASPAMEKSLYTALYHAMMAPSTSMDVNGEYRGPDNQVHQRQRVPLRIVTVFMGYLSRRATTDDADRAGTAHQRSGAIADCFTAGEPIRDSASVAV